MNHLTRLFTFTDFCNLKFCAIAKTCFASVTVMLKKIIQIKYAIQMIWLMIYGTHIKRII